jgi:hypothetical protein
MIFRFYYFILFYLFSSKSQTSSPDVFAREASILDKVHPKKFFVGDKCRFDLIKSELFNHNHHMNK